MVDPQPARSKIDIAHTLARAGISALPWLGGSAAELFALVIAPPLERRRAEWLDSLAEKINLLEKEVEGFTAEALAENEAFVTCMMYATQMAIRNHQDEKLEALRNALLNSAMPDAPDEDLQMMYLHYVDDLTPWHLRILRLFEDPNIWLSEHEISVSTTDGGPRSIMLEDVFPTLEGRRDYYRLLVKDLHARGLLMTDQIHIGFTSPGVYMRLATDIGINFLNFISSPLDKR